MILQKRILMFPSNSVFTFASLQGLRSIRLHSYAVEPPPPSGIDLSVIIADHTQSEDTWWSTSVMPRTRYTVRQCHDASNWKIVEIPINIWHVSKNDHRSNGLHYEQTLIFCPSLCVINNSAEQTLLATSGNQEIHFFNAAQNDHKNYLPKLN